MLILAGVSLNALVGDNGIITNAQNASMKSGIAALEEWLQEEYINYWEDVADSSNINKVSFLNSKLGSTLLLKDGTRDYIINNGQVYYLLNKSCSYIPDEIKNGLIGGNSTSYSDYAMLKDVYGITKELKVFYCDSDGINTYGTAIAYDIDENETSYALDSNSAAKAAIKELLNLPSDANVNLKDVASKKNLNLNSVAVNDLTAFTDMRSVRTLTLSNMTLDSLSGIEYMPYLNRIELNSCNITDYTAIKEVDLLEKLFIYFKPEMEKDVCNDNITHLGIGLNGASTLNKFEYFGISGDQSTFTDNYESDSFYSSNRSQLTDISGLANFNSNIKKSLKYIILNNNNLSSISSLDGFIGVNRLDLMCNANLTSLHGLENRTNIEFLYAHYCNLSSLDGITGCTRLNTITLQYNRNLTSLGKRENTNSGIASIPGIIKIVAHHCNISDISALADVEYLNRTENGTSISYVSKINVTNKNLSYLDLAYNGVTINGTLTSNLVVVDSLGGLTGLSSLYLDGNTSMDYDSDESSSTRDLTKGIGVLNTIYVYDIENNRSRAIISQLSNGLTNIPNKYWSLFSNTSKEIDFSLEKYKKKLTGSSNEVNILKTRTDLSLLNLQGQDEIPMSDIKTILQNNREIKYLGLLGCSQFNDLSDVAKLSSLTELDLRGVSETITDLSALNSLGGLRCLIVDDKRTDLSVIPNIWNHGSIAEKLYGWTNANYGPVLIDGNMTSIKVGTLEGVTSSRMERTGNNMANWNQVVTTGTMDLTKTSLESFKEIFYQNVTFKMPRTLKSYSGYFSPSGTVADLSLCRDLVSVSCSVITQPLLDSLATIPSGVSLGVFSCTFSGVADLNVIDCIGTNTDVIAVVPSNWKRGELLVKDCRSIYVDVGSNTDCSILGLEDCVSLQSCEIRLAKSFIGDIDLRQLKNLRTIKIYKCPVSSLDLSNVDSTVGSPKKITSITVTDSKMNVVVDGKTQTLGLKTINGLEYCTDLTSLTLSNNLISDLTFLTDAIQYEDENDQVGSIKFTTLDLSSNEISVIASDSDSNYTALKKLKAAGLQKITLSKNNIEKDSQTDLALKELFGASNYTNTGV